jgi:hypothetical protein
MKRYGHDAPGQGVTLFYQLLDNAPVRLAESTRLQRQVTFTALSTGFAVVVRHCLLLLSAVLMCPSVAMAQNTSTAMQELMEAEGLLYDGNYMEALRRLAISAKELRAKRNVGALPDGAPDPQLLNAIYDILKGQIYLTQGYPVDADSMFKRAHKTLVQRRVVLQPAGINVASFVMREGLVQIYRGELALNEASQISARDGSEPAVGTARELLEDGIETVKSVVKDQANLLRRARNGLEWYDLKRYVYQAELRRIQLLLLEKDVSRARAAYSLLDEEVTGGDDPKSGDLFWQAVFRPDVLPREDPVDPNAGGGAATATPPSAPQTAIAAGQPAELKPEDAKKALLGQVRTARGGHATSDVGRMLMRMGRFYGDMLSVEADLLRAESKFLKDDTLLLVCEEKAVKARDIAQEGAWGTPSVIEADVALANAYADSLRLASRTNSAGGELFDYKGQTINVGEQQLKSFVEDVKMLTDDVQANIEALGLAKTHPTRLMALVLQKRLASEGLLSVSAEDLTKNIDEYFDAKRSVRAKPAPTKPVFFEKPPKPARGDAPSLLNTEVTQKSGVVCLTDAYVASSNAVNGPSCYLVLDPEKAVGVVTEINDQEQYAVVEFASTEGWEVKEITKASIGGGGYLYRNWWTGEVRYFPPWKTEFDRTIRFGKDSDGLLLTGSSGVVTDASIQPGGQSANSVGTPAAGTPAAGTPAAGTPAAGTPAAGTPAAGTPAAGAAGTPQAAPAISLASLALPIQVRFPMSVISLRPPRVGDLVKRGPDWNKGHADGGDGMTGRIILRAVNDKSIRTSDGYVTVLWDATKRTGRYRWDVRRQFDIWPTAESFSLPQLVSEKEKAKRSSAQSGTAGEAYKDSGDASSSAPQK